MIQRLSAETDVDALDKGATHGPAARSKTTRDFLMLLSVVHDLECTNCLVVEFSV